ncbi:hypothetical protein TgHK011_003168 [Trichoderma gracile]|nr:hypothetical protein TgHK011_003168 [Trichoderma gracile]
MGPGQVLEGDHDCQDVLFLVMFTARPSERASGFVHKCRANSAAVGLADDASRKTYRPSMPLKKKRLASLHETPLSFMCPG